MRSIKSHSYPTKLTTKQRAKYRAALEKSTGVVLSSARRVVTPVRGSVRGSRNV